MPSQAKIKPKQRDMVVFTAFLLAVLLIARLVSGPSGFYWALSLLQILMVLIHTVVMFRTRNPIYLISVFMYALLALTFLPTLGDSSLHLVYALGASILLVLFIAVQFTKKMNWRYREILEWAAKPVDGTADGYTSRPYTSGEIACTREEAVGLGHFLLKHAAVYPVLESNRVVYVIPRNMWAYLFWIRRGYGNGTYVAFTNSGKVLVRIDRKDYEFYTEELTFDQLCASLGDLFKTFMAWYKEGRTGRIMEGLNRV